MRRLRVTGAALAALLAAVLALGSPAALALAADDTDDGGRITVTVPERDQPAGAAIRDAQFRWGLNAESGAGAFAGGCNFLSAGRAGDVGRGGVVWTEAHGLYRATAGAARVEKPSASGEYRLATWADRCLDAAGNPVSAGSLTSTSGNQVVIDGGTGTRNVDGSLEIRWTGSFSVVFYGGMTYWSASNPVLRIDARGNGQVTATASGFGSSMEDLSQWTTLPERSIVLAEIRSADVSAAQGFATDPLYLGVQVADAGQIALTNDNRSYWGAFPASFVQYQKLTGQAGYWLSTGGVRDRAKIPSTLYISYDARVPVAVTPPAVDGGGTADPNNTVRTRPAAGLSDGTAAGSVPVGYPLADPTTALPAGEGLVPDIMAGLSNPVVLPLLGTALALSLAIVAVLNLMQAFPWQRARP